MSTSVKSFSETYPEHSEVRDVRVRIDFENVEVVDLSLEPEQHIQAPQPREDSWSCDCSEHWEDAEEVRDCEDQFRTTS